MFCSIIGFSALHACVLTPTLLLVLNPTIPNGVEEEVLEKAELNGQVEIRVVGGRHYTLNVPAAQREQRRAAMRDRHAMNGGAPKVVTENGITTNNDDAVSVYSI
jgi:hypothetical protein